MHKPETSLSWRCCGCGRLRFASEQVPSPSACTDCGGTAFDAVGPFSNPSGNLMLESAGASWPVVERRKSSRS